jgi:hypothetical protein
MVWFGVIVMVVGTSLRFGFNGDTAHWSGLAALAVGAVLVIGGLLRAKRRRRKRRPGIGIPFDYKTSKGRTVAMVIAAIYILSPLDFIPEAFLGPFGLVDDVGALSWLAMMAGQEFTRHRQSKQALRG